MEQFVAQACANEKQRYPLFLSKAKLSSSDSITTPSLLRSSSSPSHSSLISRYYSNSQSNPQNNQEPQEPEAEAQQIPRSTPKSSTKIHNARIEAANPTGGPSRPNYSGKEFKNPYVFSAWDMARKQHHDPRVANVFSYAVRQYSQAMGYAWMGVATLAGTAYLLGKWSNSRKEKQKKELEEAERMDEKK